MNKINYKSFAFHLLVPIMLLFIIIMLVPDYGSYYNNLAKPFPVLESFIFFGIYAITYFIFGLAAYFVDEEEGEHKKAFNYYYISMFMNLLYIPITFGTRSLLVGFLWSFLLIVFIFLTYKEFRKINKLSGKLFIIYFVVANFITYYSFMLFLLNR
ncbi:MAG TPA: tryptophan-rich sensory protein [Acholeplasmataceae bacterium]|nr:tryptophan-rich sensory protein [Acholeplasmataceae bacterium]